MILQTTLLIAMVVNLAILIAILKKISYKNVGENALTDSSKLIERMDTIEETAKKLNEKIENFNQSANTQNKMTMDQLSRLGDSVNGGISNLGNNLQSSTTDSFNKLFETMTKIMTDFEMKSNKTQEQYQKQLTEKLSALESGFDKIRAEILATLDKINITVNEKLQTTLDSKLNLVSETLVKNMSELGGNLNDSQDRQQKQMTAKLTALESGFDKIRAEILATLDKINITVNEKLQTTLDSKLNLVSETLVKNMSELGGNLNDSQDRQQKQMTAKLSTLESGFDKIRAEILETLDKIRETNLKDMEKLREENQNSLDKINNTVNEKLQKSIDERLSQSFATVSQQLADVYKGLGEMKTVASGVSDLKNILSNVKTRGILGEIQLSSILSEILAPEQYEEQVIVKTGSIERVDFAVKLPGSEKGKTVYLPIDSKFPGDTYSNLISAQESGDAEQVRRRRSALEAEIKRCAKSIHDKYINPPETTDFALMFLPFEGLYAEVVNMGLVEILQRDYRINIVGPSTMAAMLNSLQMGFRTLAIQKKSSEVWEILSAAKKEFKNFEDVLASARTKLQRADDELEKLIGTRTRAINRKLSSIETSPDESDSKALLEMF